MRVARRLHLQAAKRYLPHALRCCKRRFSLLPSTISIAKLALQKLPPGGIGGDEFLRTGVPDSKFDLPEHPDCSSDIHLQRIFKEHSNSSPFLLVRNEIESVLEIMKVLVNSDSDLLRQVAKHLMQRQGKLIRPTINLLLARALNPIDRKLKNGDHGIEEFGYTTTMQKRQRLAEITEMIHTASLMHDDIIDEAETRRGDSSTHSKFGTKMSVLGGDFLLAQAAVSLSLIEIPQVIQLMASSIADLVKGEFLQAAQAYRGSLNDRLQNYKTICYYKTASLIAKSCRAIAVLCGNNESLQDIAYEYGKHLGLAFQIVDDLLDVSQTSKMLGKPSSKDISQGIATAPILYASEQFPRLKELIERKFKNDGDVSEAMMILGESNGLERARELANYHGKKAVAAILKLEPSDERSALINLVQITLDRQK